MSNNNSARIGVSTLFITVVLSLVSCKSEYIDPSRANGESVLNSISGLTGIDVGLQRVYSLGRASSLFNMVSINGLVTREIFLLNQGNTAEAQLSTGGTAVDGTNTMLAGLWTSSNKITYDADNVINAASSLPDKSIASGLIGYATIFKALAIGGLSTFWEQVPETNGFNVKFIGRNEGFLKAIAAIDNALGLISANPINPSFSANVPAGIDIVNSLRALKARYSLYTGNYAQALAAANLVDLSKRSTLNFEASNPNPVYDVSGSNFNVYQPIDSSMGLPAGLQPDLTDKRVPFYMALSGSPASRFVMRGFAAGSTSAFPIYLPGEMLLIKAESYARQAQPDLGNALTELNKVVTKTPANDPFGVGADLPPLTGISTQAQLLAQIYRHRCIELYMSGLKLEDMRRFARPNTERTRNLMPYPLRERDNNLNTPADPAF